MMNRQPSVTLRQIFSGMTESIFQTELGVADPRLIDYVSDLLMRFVHIESSRRVRASNGRPLDNVADMLSEASERVGDARRAVHRHIGDFTLFWSGVYPEAVGRRNHQAKDGLLDYFAHGKRAYYIASTIECSNEAEAPPDVLERLSREFEMCAYGLREVRREWERRDDDEELRPYIIN